LIAAIVLLGSAGSAVAWQPRSLPIKPAQSTVPPGYDRSHIQVKFVDDLEVVMSLQGVPAVAGRSVPVTAAGEDVLTGITESGGTWQCITGTWGDQVDELQVKAERNLDRELADLRNYYTLSVPDGIRTEDWLDQLNALEEVEIALAMPVLEQPFPPDFQAMQGFLIDAPSGIGAETAWRLPGGTGAPVTGEVRICDFEHGINPNHEDLAPITVLVPPGYTPSDPTSDAVRHGTAIMGEMVSHNNGWGTTGASFGSQGYFSTYLLNGASNLSVAMTYALTVLEAGDIFLLEIHFPGPNWPSDNTTFGYVPVDWWAPWYAVVLSAVGNGIHVVEAAGNGDEDFDDPVYSTGHAPFLPANNSGAIMVGAGASPNGSDVDRSRLTCNTWGSNWGSRLDLQGWGEAVTTTGGGTLYSTEGDNYYYMTAGLCGGGTSTASPNVASAVAIIESIYETATGGVPLPPDQMRDLLIATGTPQQSGLNPASEQIGPRPNVIAAIEELAPPCPVLITGDVDESGAITSADIIGTVNYVFKSGPLPMPCEAAGDTNWDGTVTSSDIIYLVNHTFKGGPLPLDACVLTWLGVWSCP